MGGLLNFARIAGALLILFGWVAWIGYRFVQGGNADDSTFFPLFILAQWVAPNDFQRTVVFRTAIAASAAAWLALIWRVGSPDYQKIAFVLVGAVFGFCVLAWLYDKGYRRWKAIESPTTRVFIATSLVTVAVVVGGMTALYLAARMGAAAEGVEGNWMVTALILYLPLMGLIAFGYDRWRKRKNGK